VKPNTLLFTRDGTQIGNAIVVECVGGLHTLLTDYGTRIREMTTAELSGLFVLVTPQQRRVCMTSLSRGRRTNTTRDAVAARPAASTAVASSSTWAASALTAT